MKYLKVFETDADQQNYINGEFDRPNITIVRHKKQSINYVPNIIDGEDDADKIVNHGVITLEGDTYYLTFQFPIACEYMTVDCIPQYWELRKGSSRTASHGVHFEGLGDTIEIYASNNGYDDYNATNEDDTYIYEVVIEIQKSLITFTINGNEYQAEDGMTFYDWALSEYYDSSCNLFLIVGGNDKLKDTIINTNISPDESFTIFYGSGGMPIIPRIYTDTIIQSISYTPDSGEF